MLLLVTELAFAPGYQGNLSARKEWGMSGGNTGHWQAQVTFSDKIVILILWNQIKLKMVIHI